MDADLAVEIGRQALWVTIMLAAPILLSGLIVGLIIGMIQAATQINEQTLSFVPKLGIMALTLFIASPWMLTVIQDFMMYVMQQVPAVVR